VIEEDLTTGWRFGSYPFELLVKPRRLMRGYKVVPLTDTEMSLLLLLVKREGDLVRKEEIVKAVWAGRPISDSVLSTTFLRLRGKVGESVIATVHGIGYRLACETEQLGSEEEAYAEYLSRRFERAEMKRQSMLDAEWDRQYLPLMPDVRGALDRSLENWGRRHLAVSLAGSTARLWERASQLAEGRSYVDRAIGLIDADTLPADAARLLRYGGMLWREADRPRALDLLERSAAIYRRLHDLANLGPVLGLIGDAQLHLGRHANARKTLEEAEAILNKTDQTKALWNVLNALGLLSSMENSPSDATKYFGLARDLAQMLHDKLREFIVVLNLGELEFGLGAIDRAIERAKEAQIGLRDSPISYRVRPLVNLATYSMLRGRREEARGYAAEAIGLATGEGGYWLRLCLQVWALIAAQNELYAEAARLLGFIERQFTLFGEARQPAEQRIHTMILEILGTRLSPDSISVWTADGGKWKEEHAIEFVVERLMPAEQTAAL
jgi:DNA-binding winged helix-turn-helix (wHTH) protein